MTCVLDIIFRLPPTPVEKDHQRETLRRCVGRQPQITKLILAGTIVDTMVSGRRGARQNVHSDKTMQSSLRIGRGECKECNTVDRCKLLDSKTGLARRILRRQGGRESVSHLPVA